ncbi:MAG: restriction endonuclease subunit S [Agathobacter sp.]|nr:restriction endonuclease subunit S [Agathobacter sp.]
MLTHQFKQFQIGDLFEVKPSKRIFHATNVVVYDKKEKGTYPYIVRKTSNNGLKGYIKASSNDVNPGNTISFAQDTFISFYQAQPYVTGNKIKVLMPNFERFNEKIALYIIASLNKALVDYTWGVGSDKEKIKSFKIDLPIDVNGNIDFEYMEARIKELEEARIKELEEALRVMGLHDTKLNADEIASLTALPTFKTFKVIDLFDVVGTKSLDEGKLTFQQNGINFVGRVGSNNGIKGKIERQKFLPNEPNTFTATVIGNYKYVRYQEEEYYCSQNINKLIPKFDVNRDIALYFIAILNKFVSKYNGQQGGYKLDDLKTFEFIVPVTINEEIDFDYIKAYIRALQKLTIQKLYDDKGIWINKTKEVTDIPSSSDKTTKNIYNDYFNFMSSDFLSALKNLTPEQMTNALIYAGEQACGEKLDDKYHTMIYNWMNALHQAIMVSTISIGAIIAADPELQTRINTNQNWMRSIQVIKAKITDKRNKRAEVETTITAIVEDDLATLIARGYDKYSVKNTYQEAQSNA